MHALLFTISLLLQAAPPSATDRVGDAYWYFLQARSLDGADDVAGAIDKCKQALAILPQSADLYAELSSLYARQRAMPEARAAAERALQLDARNRLAHRMLGLMQADASQTAPPDLAGPVRAEAIRHLEIAIGEGFQDLLAQFTLGQLYLSHGQHAKAIATLEAFLVERPGFLQAVRLLSEAYRAVGRSADADGLLASLHASVDSPAARVRDVADLEEQGRWREAAEGWARLAAETSDNLEYRLRQAGALANSGSLDAAREVVTAAAAAHPQDVSAWYLLAQIEQRAGRPQAADEAAGRIGRISPSDPRGPLALAELRATRKDYRGVVDALDPRVTAASAADVDDGAYAQMVSMLGDALIELKQGDRAVKVLETARRRAPADQGVLFSLAATYERAGQFDRAERTFRDVIAHDPQHARALNYLGYMLANRNRKVPEAVDLISRALAIDEDNPSYLDSLGWAYFRMAQFDKALEPLERAATEVPQSSVIQDHLGDLYLKLDRYRDAAAAFDRALSGDGDGIDRAAIQKKRDRAQAKARTP
ncbi:MAG: tetratricopeptide repeat protein [Vicinamibacterales bacterium]